MSNSMISMLFLVAAGGAAGSALRHLLSQTVTFPFGTLAVNVAGSLAIGIAFVALSGRGGSYPLVVPGLLGGFTTFSAFSLDTIRLVEAGRFGAASAYVVASVVLSLLACLAGLWLARGTL
jgi:CrcB protein